MSTIIFPGVRTDRLDNPLFKPVDQVWTCVLCSQCGRLDRYEPSEEDRRGCNCVPERADTAVIGLFVADEDQIWENLTFAGIADHVISRVIRIMCGDEEEAGNG